MKHLSKLIVGVALGAATLYGGKVAAGDYPPDATSPTTVVASTGTVTGVRVAEPGGGSLPETGSDSSATLMLAGGALVAGSGILVASKLRRRPANG
jgi:LPXTG-motif cell wall-anchored protein